jgi:hypothetical protein
VDGQRREEGQNDEGVGEWICVVVRFSYQQPVPVPVMIICGSLAVEENGKGAEPAPKQ